MATVFLGLGSNLGSRRSNLLRAVNALHSAPVRVHALSDCYQSEPVGKRDQPDFLNAVCRLRCSLSPERLLAYCLEIERRLGRVRRVRWGPRQIDLDILYYDRLVKREPGLRIPHPRLHRRRFVLAPLAELCPLWWDPLRRRTVIQLLQACEDSSRVVRVLEQ